MKKNVKNVLVASTAALALVGSFMGCAQPTAPEATKKIYEQNLSQVSLKARSEFGMNVIQISDVNYADSYTIWRFGPNDGPEGKYLYEIKQSNNGLDSFVYNDVISKENVLVPGSYTYKVIAKSANSSRAVDLSKDDKDKTEAGQGSWANPNNDVSFIPSISEVRVDVKPENVPAYRTKIDLKKEEVKIISYLDEATNNTIIEVVPGTSKGVTLEARLSGLDKDFPTKTFKADESNSKITISAQLAGKWDIYAQREWKPCDAFPATTAFKKASPANDYYLSSDKVLVGTVDVAKWIKKDVVSATTDVEANNFATFTWELDSSKYDYKFNLQRSERTLTKNPNGTNAVEYGPLTTVEVTPIKVGRSNDGTKDIFVAKDAKAEKGKTYAYFWSFTDNKDKAVVAYGEAVVEIEIKALSEYLTLEDITRSQLTPSANKATDPTWAKLTNEFSVKVSPKSGASATVTEKAMLADVKKENISIKRIATSDKKYYKEDAITTFEVYPLADGNKAISVKDVLDFTEDKKGTNYYYYITIKSLGYTFEPWNFIDKGSDGSESNKYITTISNKRYDGDFGVTVAFDETKNVKETEATFDVEFTKPTTLKSYKTRGDVDTSKAKVETNFDGTVRFDDVNISDLKLAYDVQCVNNNNFVINGGDLATALVNKDSKDTNKKTNGKYTLTVKGLVPGFRYTVTIGSTSKTFNTKNLAVSSEYKIANLPAQFAINDTLTNQQKFEDTQMTTLTYKVAVQALQGKNGKFEEYDLVDVTRKVPVDSIVLKDKCADVVWYKNKANHDGNFAVNVNTVLSSYQTGSLREYEIVDQKFPLDNVAKKIYYEFRFYDTVNKKYVTLSTEPVVTKSATRWTDTYTLMVSERSTTKLAFNINPTVTKDPLYKVSGQASKDFEYVIYKKGSSAPDKKQINVTYDLGNPQTITGKIIENGSYQSNDVYVCELWDKGAKNKLASTEVTIQ